MGIEELERAVFALGLAGDHLVGGDGDGLDFLLLTRILTDLLGREAGAAQQLIAPLAPSYGVGHEDERGGLCFSHGGSTDDGLARATGQDHDAGATGPEGFGGILLIIPKLPVHLLRAQRDGMGFAVDIAGAVIGGPAGFEQLLFEPPASGGRHGDGAVIDARAQKFADFFGARELF